ncbi:CPBP family intramembrane glutamic endopeptidase [Williamsoniiplasma lucivorax]|uniref:CAAX amino terminal membrane bound protease n=1 Tax=Williamsoniiplasma lucivorax TaxID=209274 RepID=A0A2S5RA38_9MOLU|nr:CPBP family intramembrane glutamic endopeptidase [Williamsoniiplasma lucivorax]PPE04163.1 CAAX amino terminal membrane bound protease [Williamsoniiplasma lucivorax]
MNKKNVWDQISIPSSETNEKYPFYFKLYNPANDGIIFIVTSLLIPLLSLFMFRFIGGMSTNQISKEDNALLSTLHFLVLLVSALIGFIILLTKDRKLFIKSGLFIFYGFQLFVPLLGLVFGNFTNLLNVNQDWNQIIFLWLQIIAELIVIIFAFKWTIDLKEKIISTFKKDWLKLLIITIIVTGLLIGIGSFLYNYLVQGTPLGGTSANQDELVKLIHHDDVAIRVIYCISLFVLTILMAPLLEELASRHAWSVGCGNRTVAWITSALFFGMIHVSSGDVEHILGYILAGCFFATTFNLTRGNVTYTWIVHASNNAIAYMLLFIS